MFGGCWWIVFSEKCPIGFENLYGVRVRGVLRRRTSGVVVHSEKDFILFVL